MFSRWLSLVALVGCSSAGVAAGPGEAATGAAASDAGSAPASDAGRGSEASAAATGDAGTLARHVVFDVSGGGTVDGHRMPMRSGEVVFGASGTLLRLDSSADICDTTGAPTVGGGGLSIAITYPAALGVNTASVNAYTRPDASSSFSSIARPTGAATVTLDALTDAHVRGSYSIDFGGTRGVIIGAFDVTPCNAPTTTPGQ